MYMNESCINHYTETFTYCYYEEIAKDAYFKSKKVGYIFFDHTMTFKN